MIPCTRVTAYRLFVSLMLVVVMMTLGTSVLSAQQSGLEQTSQLRIDGPPAPTPPQVITRDATGMEATVRVVGFGGSAVWDVLDSAKTASIDRIEVADLSDFSHGEIDWRGRLDGAHWLVLSTSSVLAGDSARSAQGAGMTFAEFEGPRTVMVLSLIHI